MISQPKSLVLLFSAEFVERLSYWGLQSLLVLYLMKSLAMPSDKVYLIYGTFSALAFSLIFFGGIVADRILGFRRAIIIGILFAIAGNICLALPNLNSIYIGLTLIVCGVGLFTPNNSNLLGTFYQAGDSRRDKGFTLLYVGTNLGGLIGPVLYGIISTHYGWHYSFLVSAILLMSWLMLFFFKRNYFIENGLPQKNRNNPIKTQYLFYPLLIIVVIAIWFLLQHLKFAGELLAAEGIICFLFLMAVAAKSEPKERYAIFVLLAMIIFSLLFFSNELQVNSSLLLFTEQYIDRRIFGLEIPTNIFAALEPLAIIILTPSINYLVVPE